MCLRDFVGEAEYVAKFGNCILLDADFRRYYSLFISQPLEATGTKVIRGGYAYNEVKWFSQYDCWIAASLCCSLAMSCCSQGTVH